jgi:hypothetical protein
MGDKPDSKTGSSATKSGVLPRVDQQELRAIYEAAMRPNSLPEIDEDLTSITGAIIINAEGIDKAKQADDSATTEKSGQ